MIEIEQIIESLPTGKLNSYLNKIYRKGLINFFKDNNELEAEFNINSLIASEFKFLILEDDIIKDLKLFPNEYLKNLLQVEENEIENQSINQIRNKIISYYDFTYELDINSSLEINISSNCEARLHDFQERMRRKVINLIFNGSRRFLIHMPTGAGKTRTAVEIIIDFIRLSSAKALLSDNFKILWIAQSSELCHQAYQTFEYLYNKKGTNEIQLGHFYGSNDINNIESNKPAIIFCGIQKLLQNYKKSEWNTIRANNYLVIVDEAHRSVASQWKKALDFFVGNSNTFLLGLTATPGSGSIDDLSGAYSFSSYYENNKITLTDENYIEIAKPIEYLVNREFLAEIERIDIQSKVYIQNEPHTGKEGLIFSDKTLEELSVSSMRNMSIINIIRKHVLQNKKILVFTCGIEHNKILKTLLSTYSINSEFIDASTKNRNHIINEFKNGDLNVLLNFGVLTTGFDAPKTDVCIIARPVTSIVMYSQMVGRILRGPKNQGNKKNTLYTIRDNFDHGDYDQMFNTFNDFYK
ncbi:MAG: DEAD/DEAH box helicase family protein [Cloacibacterium sp.]|nr:DEAD/DEAH box helicase family protein [Cloacibacterium sp.]